MTTLYYFKDMEKLTDLKIFTTLWMLFSLVMTEFLGNGLIYFLIIPSLNAF